jgi:aryl-alcohol dehydrogenase-like predicted oxidoreductase
VRDGAPYRRPFIASQGVTLYIGTIDQHRVEGNMSSSISRRKFLAASAASVGAAATASFAAPGGLSEGLLPVRPLGLTGMMPTILGFGGGSRYLTNEDMGVAEQIIHRAFELGVRYFDTAHSYGRDLESVKRFGRFLVPDYRKDVLIASKVGARDAETARRQIDECFTHLKTDVIDILHFHAIGSRPEVDQIVAADGALKVFRELKESGAIRAIGVTGHADSGALLYAMERIEPDCLMCPQNPGHGESGQNSGSAFARDVIPHALKHGIGLLAMKTTGQNQLTGKGGVSAPELVRYAMSLPVASAIVGILNLGVLESCAQVARDLRPMSEPEMANMRQQLLSVVDPRQTLPYLTPGYVDGHPFA